MRHIILKILLASAILFDIYADRGEWAQVWALLLIMVTIEEGFERMKP